MVFPTPAHAPANELYKHIPGMTTRRTPLLPRHAESGRSAGTDDDFSRLLSTRGSQDSPKAGTGRGNCRSAATLAQLPVSGNWHNLRAGTASLVDIMRPRNLPQVKNK
jgi:hypothetical protein